MENQTIEGDQVEESPIEQVRLTVPTTDDWTLPVLTFRTWFLGLTTCTILSSINTFTSFRQNPVTFPLYGVQLLMLPAGKLMAAVLPAKNIRIPGTKWEVPLNPGPFNIKEHVIISMFASAGGGSPFAIIVMATTKFIFGRPINPLAFFLLVLTTTMLSYGYAGLFMKFFVETSNMWWPECMPQVSFFRALHEKEVTSGRNLTRNQFFFLVVVVSFSYYVVPGYFFPSISALSCVCWIWKHSITAQQLGSGLSGLGLGSFSLDWATVTGFGGSPLLVPFYVIANYLFGFILFLYIVVPIAYSTNSFKAKNFPLLSTNIYDAYGNPYNLSRIMDEKTFQFNQEGYDNYSEIYLSVMRAYSYGFGFVVVLSCLSDAALSHGWSIWAHLKKARRAESGSDIHVKMMKKYDIIPWWWFIALLVLMMVLAILTCERFEHQLQLPYWGALLACLLVPILMLPFGVLRATTGQQPSLYVLNQLIIGYLYPGRPLANVVFDLYSAVNLDNALSTLSSFKLGTYMKIPPKAMFLSQVIGNLVSVVVDFATSWWLFSSVESMCQPDKLPEGSPWTCPVVHVIYNGMVTMGVVGPYRMFYPMGVYSKLFLFFLLGALAPVFLWIVARAFPEKKWLKLVSIPLIFLPGSAMPPARAVNYSSWILVGFIFNFVIYRKYKNWWGRYNYLLSVSLDVGVAMMAFLVTVALQIHDINGIDWWGLDVSDHCPLATCPTAPGVRVEGCPVIT